MGQLSEQLEISLDKMTKTMNMQQHKIITTYDRLVHSITHSLQFTQSNM